MALIPDLIERLKALVMRARVERELDEELRFHLHRDEEERRRTGSPTPRRDALLAFGGVERIKEEVRDARGVRPLEELTADTRYALRALLRNPGFTTAVVLVLGIAIGSAAAVFTVVGRVLVAELPYPDGGRLVRIFQKNSPTNLWSLSVVDLEAIGAEQRVFEAWGAARYGSASLSGAGAPERIAIGSVTSGFFTALEVRAAAGRLPGPGDDRPDAAPVVVLSHRLAERAFGVSAAAPGRSIMLDGTSHRVVGVLEAGRDELAGIKASAWPILQLRTPERRGPFGYRGIARLADGVSLEQATRDLDGISRRIFPIWASSFRDSTARLTAIPLRDAIVGRASSQLGMFAGAVGLMLLLAVANVATLMLVRISSREQELTVRAALGAGRRRLARLVITECVVLTMLAGLAGLLVAAIGLRLVGVISPELPRLAEVRLDPVGAGLVILIALVSGLLVSATPLAAVLGRRARTAERLVAAGGRAGTGRGANRLRSALVVAEFAFALPLLLGAGLLFNSFLRLQRVEPGFDPAGLYGLELALPPRYGTPAERQGFWRQVEARVTALNGIAAAGLSGSVPPDNYGDVNNFDLLDRPVSAGTAEPVAPWPPATTGYFAALGIRLLEGRMFTFADSAEAPPVVVVSRAWATRYYPGESPLGKQMVSGGCVTCPPTTVIGVVSDVHYSGLAGSGDAVYPPLAQTGPRVLSLVVRSRLGAGATFRDLRLAIAGIDPDLAPVEIVLADRLREALGDPRRWTVIVGGFAVTGALLAAVGVFGLMSYLVRQRQRELGLRLALGAAPESLTAMVVRRGLGYAAAGSVVGMVLFAGLSRWLGSLLFGVAASDPLTIGFGLAGLVAVAALACWIPGRRAARIRPVESLSAD